MYKCTFNIEFIDGKDTIKSNNLEVETKEKPNAFNCVFALIIKSCKEDIQNTKYIGLLVRDVMVEAEEICKNILKFEIIKVEEK